MRIHRYLASATLLAATAAAQSASPTMPLTAADLDAFVGGIITQQLQTDDIAGAVVSIVKDGQVVFAKGYGYADVERRTPVTVDATLFRIGSVTKTFTWTAVMQLVQDGKIDLGRDVNAYIDFRVPAAFGKPVTMLNLMTHTPGFEEVLGDLITTSDVPSITHWLPSHLPRQIYPPGTTPAYSNYGATLAGYIVERVSGMPFEGYVAKQIFAPLHLAHTTFAQPLPTNLAPLMSKGYGLSSEPPKPFEGIETPPAGAVSTTAEDMSRFMIAFLQDQGVGGATLLEPKTKQLMFSRAFGTAPAMNGMAHGFYEENRNGHHIVGHSGDTQWFHSDMHLMLDDHVGFFVSYNSRGNGKVDPRAALWRAFLDRYFPYAPPPVSTLATNFAHARAVVGTYESSVRDETTIFSMIFMLTQTMVTLNADSTISNGAQTPAGTAKRYREVAPWIFQEVNGQDRVAFPIDYTGRRIMADDDPTGVAQPTPVMKRRSIALAVLGLALGAMLLTLLAWPVGAVLRRHYAHPLTLAPAARRLLLLVRLGVVCCLLFVALWAQFLSGVQDDLSRFNSGADLTLRLFQVLALVGALGAIPAIIHAARTWSDRSMWRWAATWNAVVAAAFLAYLGFLLNWHVLTLSLRY